MALGDALSRSIRSTFEPLVGKEAAAILAAFAIGGDSGMSMDVVAATLQRAKSDVYSIVTDLAAGGVITEVVRLNTLSVIPATLRFALIRDVFYTGPKSLDVGKLIENAASLDNVIKTLIGAKARGAIIPADVLLDLLERSQSANAWNAYAWSGREEARMALSRHPELLKQLARASLNNAPETVIPILLKAAKGDERALHSSPDHPLRIISDWIQSGEPGTGEALRRRSILLDAIITPLSKGDDINVALKALPLVFSLRYEDHTTDPGRGMTVIFTSGVVTDEETKRLGEFWKKTFPIVGKLKDADWNIILDVIGDIAFPGPPAGKAGPAFYSTTRELAAQMIKDVMSVSVIGQGVLHKLKKIVKRKKLAITIALDKEFETLYPIEEIKEWKAAQEREFKEVAELADKWAAEPASSIAKKIAVYELEAQLARITYPRRTPNLCSMIAQKTQAHILWVGALANEKLDPWLIEPFLRAAVAKNEADWETVINGFLDSRTMRGIAVTILLTIPVPPPHLLNKALENLGGMAPFSFIETLCLRGEIPEATLIRILKHPDPIIAGKAAIGEWLAEPQGEVRKFVYNEWRTAILHMEEDEYWLGEMLSKDSLLAFEWLKKHIVSESIPYEKVQTIKKAIKPLGLEERMELLKLMRADTWRPELICALIGDSLELYQFFLMQESKKTYHLLPLHGFKYDEIGEEVWNEQEWVAKAKVALDAGYTAEDISGAIFLHGWSRSGSESEMWLRWLARYESLCSNCDPRIRKAGEIGKDKAKRECERALAEERREAIYGR